MPERFGAGHAIRHMKRLGNRRSLGRFFEPATLKLPASSSRHQQPKDGDHLCSAVLSALIEVCPHEYGQFIGTEKTIHYGTEICPATRRKGSALRISVRGTRSRPGKPVSLTFKRPGIARNSVESSGSLVIPS